jgi:hypothetical protein
MKKTIQIVSIILLAFLGISAILGGGALVIDPSGKSIEMPISLIEHSPFSSFLIPGLILFLFNGVSSIIIAVLVLKKNKYSPLLIFSQGVVQTIWIIVQIIIIRQTDILQYIYGFVGLALILCGLYLNKK